MWRMAEQSPFCRVWNTGSGKAHRWVEPLDNSWWGTGQCRYQVAMSWTYWTILVSLKLGRPDIVDTQVWGNIKLCHVYIWCFLAKKSNPCLVKALGPNSHHRKYEGQRNKLNLLWKTQGLPECVTSTKQLTWFLQQVTDLKRMGGWGGCGWLSIKISNMWPQCVYLEGSRPCKMVLVRQSGGGIANGC